MSYSTVDWFSISGVLAHIQLVEKCNVNKMADRFGELSENKIQVLLENSDPKTPKIQQI